MNRRIVINADDFGLSSGVNRAIAQAHTDGILTSATIMTNMPAAEEALEIAKKLPSLGLGVHLTLTEGRPLSKEESVNVLTNSDGEFACSHSKLSLLSLTLPKVRYAIKTEMTAQIRWLIDRGITPTHLDSHKHVHAFPIIFSMLCQLARKFGISAIRWPFEPSAVCKRPWPLTDRQGRKRATLVRTMARVNRLQDADFLKTDAFFGVAHTGGIDANFLKAVTLYSSAQTAEVMTHPGYADGLDPSKTRLVKQRQFELEALCSERTKQYFKDAGIELVNYAQL